MSIVNVFMLSIEKKFRWANIRQQPSEQKISRKGEKKKLQSVQKHLFVITRIIQKPVNGCAMLINDGFLYDKSPH